MREREGRGVGDEKRNLRALVNQQST